MCLTCGCRPAGTLENRLGDSCGTCLMRKCLYTCPYAGRLHMSIDMSIDMKVLGECINAALVKEDGSGNISQAEL